MGFRSHFHRGLVTGATGYVGYHLAEKLLQDGWEVSLLIRPGANTKKLDGLPKSPMVYKHPGDTKSLIEILKEARPEIIFHLASQVQGEHLPEDVEALIRSNILFGTQLLEAATQSGVRYFVNTGSYWQHYEGEDYNPVNLYAATKQAFEDILRFYQASSSLRAVTLKLFDVYGPEDPRDKLFQQLDRASTTGEPLKMSRGEQLLDLVYIDDVVEAYCQAAELLKSQKPRDIKTGYAVSSGRRIPLKEVVEIYQTVSRRKVPVTWGGRPYRSREVMVPWTGDSLPGWKPLTDLETGFSQILYQAAEKK